MDVIIQTQGAVAQVHNSISSEQWMATRFRIDTPRGKQKKKFSLRAIDFKMQSQQTRLVGSLTHADVAKKNHTHKEVEKNNNTEESILSMLYHTNRQNQHD